MPLLPAGSILPFYMLRPIWRPQPFALSECLINPSLTPPGLCGLPPPTRMMYRGSAP